MVYGPPDGSARPSRSARHGGAAADDRRAIQPGPRVDRLSSGLLDKDTDMPGGEHRDVLHFRCQDRHPPRQPRRRRARHGVDGVLVAVHARSTQQGGEADCARACVTGSTRSLGSVHFSAASLIPGWKTSTRTAADVTAGRSASRAAASHSCTSRSRCTALAEPSLSRIRAPLMRRPRGRAPARWAWPAWQPQSRRVGRPVHLVEVRNQRIQTVTLDLALRRALQMAGVA